MKAKALNYIIFPVFLVILSFFLNGFYSKDEEITFNCTYPKDIKAVAQKWDSINLINLEIPGTRKYEMVKVIESAPFSASGNNFSFDSVSYLMNGSPVFVHSGEMHYFRIPESQWEDYIIKARNGGLNCISTCVLWGIHEPLEGIWNFAGRYNLAHFLELCRKHKMYVILRIGPVINAETRNGGLPQWVRDRLPGQYNNKLYPSQQWYLDAVGNYYNKLAWQIKDYFPSNGGNVIMVQLDNETNCSWVWGRKETQKDAQVTADHYLRMAKEAGFEGPFAGTYWEPGFTVRPAGTIPVTGAYPIKAWSYEAYPKIDHLPMNNAKGHFYGFPPETFEQYPVFCAENQGGAGYYTVTPSDFPAGYNFIDIAGGVSATNYYMYAGGTNPQRYPGPYFNNYYGKSVVHPDVNRMSYDLMSPLGEFQQTRESYHYVRRLGLFLQSYGGTLARTRFQGNEGINNILGKEKQAAFRMLNNSGFLFINSYMLPNDNGAEQVALNITVNNESFYFPKYSDLIIYRNKPQIIPFRLNIDDLKIQYATASPLTRFDGPGGRHLVFYTNGENLAEYFIEDIKPDDIWTSKGSSIHVARNGLILVVQPSDKNNLIVVKRKNKAPVIIKTLTEEQSLTAYKLENLDSHLIFTHVSPLNINGSVLRFEYNEANAEEENFITYPGIKVDNRGVPEKQFVNTAAKLNHPFMDMDYYSEIPGEYAVEVDSKKIPSGTKEVYLNTTEIGYSKGVELYVDGMLMADSYFRMSGDSSFVGWSFGLKRCLSGHSQQWVIEKQKDQDYFKLLNKQTGEALSASSSNAVVMTGHEANMQSRQLWQLIEKGDNVFHIKNIETGLFLDTRDKNIVLAEESFSSKQKWILRFTDDYFFSVINKTSKRYLDANGGDVSIDAPTSDFLVTIKSYSFIKSYKDFSFISEYGDFVRPSSYSFLMEDKIRIKFE